MAQAILSKLKFQIGADNRQFMTSIQQSQKKLVSFQSRVSKLSETGLLIFWAIWLIGIGFMLTRIKH